MEFFTAFGIISESELLNDTSSSRTFGHDPSVTSNKNRANKVPLIISHGTYKWSRAANLKFGRFVAPVGIINIEHFPPGLFLETAPQQIRPIPGGTIWGHFLNGVDFYGSASNLEYHLNFSSFSFIGPANPVTGGTPPAGDSTRMIGGARLAYSLMNDKFVLGSSLQHGLKDAGNYTYGFDLLVNLGKLNIKNEFTRTEQDSGAGTDMQRTLLMIQPSYALSSKVRMVYRFDWHKDNRTEHIIGINYLPVDLLRLRTEFSIINFDAATSDDYTRITTSAVLSF